MSRGLGKIQKQIIEALGYYRDNPNLLTRFREGTSVRIPRKPHYIDLLGYIWGEDADWRDKSKLVSISRAVTSLEKGRLVKKGKCYCDELMPECLQFHRTVELFKR